MPISDSDPRDFFTAERSLLAWLRTGLSVIAIGFVVSRFGLFLEGLAIRSPGFLPPAHQRRVTGIPALTRPADWVSPL